MLFLSRYTYKINQSSKATNSRQKAKKLKKYLFNLALINWFRYFFKNYFLKGFFWDIINGLWVFEVVKASMLSSVMKVLELLSCVTNKGHLSGRYLLVSLFFQDSLLNKKERVFF